MVYQKTETGDYTFVAGTYHSFDEVRSNIQGIFSRLNDPYVGVMDSRAPLRGVVFMQWWIPLTTMDLQETWQRDIQKVIV